MRSDTAPETTPTERADRAPLALELLVHGVGGTTPQIMLNDPRTTRVSGDDTAGIYRRADDVDAERRPQAYQGKPVPDAYSWCNLTSGDGSRALWLLLLPFMVANLAHWMRPPCVRPGLRRAYDVLVRILALTLTVLLVAAACEVAMDLVAWQCASSVTCAGDKTWLVFLTEDRGGWWGEPGRRLGVAAALPVALTMLLWWLSWRTWYAYESQRPAPHGQPEADDVPPLALPGFWYGRRLVARLRSAHTAAGLLTVAGALVIPALRHDRTADGVLTVAGWALGTAVALLAAVAVFVTCSAGRSETGLDEEPDPCMGRLLLGGGAALLAAAVLYAGWHRPGWGSGGRLPAAGATFGSLMVLQGSLAVALAVVARRMHRHAPASEQVALRGLGGPCVALLACALGGVLSGGVAQRVADWLDRGQTPGTEAGPITGPPVLLSWQASVIPALIVALLVVAAVIGREAWRTTRTLAEEIPAEYPEENHDGARTRQIARARTRAGLTDRAPVIVCAVAAVSLACGTFALAGAWVSDAVPGTATEDAPGFVHGLAEGAQALGSWLVGASVVALVTLGRRAYRSTGARRTVGILWDVGTFWPRAAHPFAPPCYAERAVPDLTWRMTTWTERHPGGRIILSGHSQGSVLAAAAAWQLDPATRRRVALLTYGSPLERLYGRWFPAYFGPQALRSLHGELRAWRNLWRRTDPIGGPVRVPGGPGGGGPGGGGPEVDHPPLLDPAAYGRTAEHPLPAPILTHFDYRTDPAFAAERTALLVRLAREDDPWVPGVPAQGSSGRSSG